MRVRLVPMLFLGVLAFGGCATDEASFTCPGGGSGKISTSRAFLTTAATIPVCGQTATINSDPNAAAMSAAADALGKAANSLTQLGAAVAAKAATGGAAP